ncbi:MBL fold metallo-hydrolase [Pseudobacteroides cellulosolvens]|uniref:Beta-lactamase domain protein n=1 Tax=Pseudobacteroides cellulosolvens ATCC 35603 = DSM 2933 TaxID=398512 RepID=A0A0L6JJP3_9FIRM|nr:MBL fold metallo-hydrolase [Pseudobacteroides cellulosolvens]KNY25918.1 beta-lactamase domain protein [Pseudobacteroides cellulosolvens ATCC 35603 = DSM 2933]
MGKKWITKNGYIIQQVLDSNNPLLVSNKTTSILIDTGSRKKWMKLSDKINCILSNKLKLSAVILTHTHHDHVQNARSFKDTFKLDIIVHKSEAEYLKDGGSIYITSNNEKYIKNYEPVMWDIQTDDKYDLCNYDLDAYILHTPGHSTGSVSIIIDNEIAIVGDALSGLDNKPFKRTLKKYLKI